MERVGHPRPMSAYRPLMGKNRAAGRYGLVAEYRTAHTRAPASLSRAFPYPALLKSKASCFANCAPRQLQRLGPSA